MLTAPDPTALLEEVTRLRAEKSELVEALEPFGCAEQTVRELFGVAPDGTVYGLEPNINDVLRAHALVQRHRAAAEAAELVERDGGD